MTHIPMQKRDSKTEIKITIKRVEDAYYELR